MTFNRTYQPQGENPVTSIDRPKRAIDRPKEAEADTLKPLHRACLQALEMRLKAQDFVTDLTGRGLVVRNANPPKLTDTITCGPRQDDGMRLWFFTSRDEPIAEADHITDAVMQIKAYLTVRM